MTKNKFPDLTEEERNQVSEIFHCQSCGTYRGYKKNTGEPYCRYFGVTNQRRKLDCSMREDRTLDVWKGEEPVFAVKLPFYRCRARKQRGDGVELL